MVFFSAFLSLHTVFHLPKLGQHDAFAFSELTKAPVSRDQLCAIPGSGISFGEEQKQKKNTYYICFS